MDPHVFVFIGRSGSGKGTQTDLLLSYLKKRSERPVLHIETGKLLRDFVASDSSHTTGLVKSVLEAGGLLPTFMPVWIWSSELIKKFTGNEHIVIDGTPRKLHEAIMLDSALTFYKLPPPHIVYINVSNEWAQERLLERKRSDDAMIEIEKRLTWFDTDVLPIIEYYQSISDRDLHMINGEQTIEKVHADVIAAIESR